VRIMFLNLAANADFGGGENWTLNTATGLSGRGHEITVVGRAGTPLTEESEERNYKIDSVPVGIDYSPGTIRRIKKLLRNNNIEVIVVHHNKDVRTGGVAARIAGIPVVHRNGFPILHNTFRHKITYRLTDRILTNSNRIKEKYLSFGWIDPGKIDVVPNGVREINKKLDREKIREKWGVDSGNLVAVFAGRLTKVKRVKDLIAAFSMLDEKSRWKLVILGKGDEESTLRKTIDQASRDKQVLLAGFYKNAAQYLSAADLVLLPSSDEGMPNVLMESMIQGIPVASTPVGDVPYLLNDGKAGWLIKTGDVEAWADLLTKLENQSHRLIEMGTGGEKWVREHFSFDKMLDGVEDSLKKSFH